MGLCTTASAWARRASWGVSEWSNAEAPDVVYLNLGRMATSVEARISMLLELQSPEARNQATKASKS